MEAKIATYIKALIILLFIGLPIFCYGQDGQAWVKGIYVTQPTLESTKTIKRLITQAKAAGINTFVIDYSRPSKKYKQNIQLVNDSGLRYVARIVMFPDGGTHDQISSVTYWEKKYTLVQQAIDMGAKEIQLDYIRYKPTNRASNENAKNILKVINWYKERLTPQGIPLQIDVFGETTLYPSTSIGQNVSIFADSIDVLCPMVYPSHYEPYIYHSQNPYKTIYGSLTSLQKQFNNDPPFKIYAYIEVRNYRYHRHAKGSVNYIYEQIRAVEDGGAQGWYAWSPQNKYYLLFKALEQYPVK